MYIGHQVTNTSVDAHTHELCSRGRSGTRENKAAVGAECPASRCGYGPKHTARAPSAAVCVLLEHIVESESVCLCIDRLGIACVVSEEGTSLPAPELAPGEPWPLASLHRIPEGNGRQNGPA